MEKDTQKTKVVFLVNEKDKDNSDLFAFFPEEDYNNFSTLTKTCYSHVGQHSACVMDYAKESRLATKEEYADLQNELENSIGYNLELTTTFN